MIPGRSGRERHGRRGFTLMEVMIATMIFAILMAALNSVLFTALRLRAKTMDLVGNNLPLNHAISLIKRDLRGIRPPGDTNSLALDFIGEGSGTASSSMNHLDFYTTTGVVDARQDWGDLQKVSYYLRTPDATERKQGMDLVRAVTRNLLSDTIDDPVEEPLLSGVKALEFEFYDGLIWRPTWDTNAVQIPVPQAIRMVITLQTEADERLEAPSVELVMPIVTQAITNETSAASEDATGETDGTTGGGGTGGGGTGGGGTGGGTGGGGTGGGGVNRGAR